MTAIRRRLLAMTAVAAAGTSILFGAALPDQASAHSSSYCGHATSEYRDTRVQFRYHYTTSTGSHRHVYDHSTYLETLNGFQWAFLHRENRAC